MSRDYPTEGEQITEALLAIDSTIDEGFSDVCRNLDLIKNMLEESFKKTVEPSVPLSKLKRALDASTDAFVYSELAALIDEAEKESEK